MRYKSLDQITGEAEVHADFATKALTRQERLERWAQALERRPERRLHSVEGVEFGPRGVRDAKRADGSPLTVAFEDPLLRAEGLRGDRVGDAAEFFELSHDEVHGLVCYCHHGHTMSPVATAARVRALARRPEAWTLRAGALVAGASAAVVGLAIAIF